MSRSGTPGPIVVVGAGIVGLCAAAYLAEAGLQPLLLDRTGVCEETSSGNAGALAFSDIIPLAQKGMLRNLPRWLADPLGPLAIPPAYLPHVAPWLLRFWQAGRPARRQQSLAAQVSMMELAKREWESLIARARLDAEIHRDGSIELYESDAEYTASLPGWEDRRRFGIAFNPLDRAGIDDLQPGLATQFVRGVFVPGWSTVSDPKRIGERIFAHAQSHGATFRKEVVTELKPRDDGVDVHTAYGTVFPASKVVVAAGAWSHRLAATLGDTIPLETERGYNTTLPVGAFDLRRQLIFSRHGFVVTPLDTGLRVGGAVELGGLQRAPNFARADAMLEKAKHFMPGLRSEGGTRWMGYRPSLPDSLPVVGTARATGSIVYAFGHGHLGLTQSAAAGRLVRDLVLGEASQIPLSPFRPDRF